MPQAIPAISRRQLLKTTGALTLAFTIPVSLADTSAARYVELPGDLSHHPHLDAWLRISADGKVTLMIGKVEIGQGVLTAVQQVCAEELDVAFERISIISGDTERSPDEGVTAGSRSMSQCASAVQQAAAEAREILLQKATQKLNVERSALTIDDGRITARSKGTTTYWELVEDDTLSREATGETSLKDRAAYRYIGKPVERIDLAPKMRGEPVFIQELRPEGMVHGRVVRGPVHGAKLVSVDSNAVETMPGVLKVVKNGSFLGVVAEREETAEEAAARLADSAGWEAPDRPQVNHETIYDWMRNARANVSTVKEEPRSDGEKPARTLEAEYLRPFQMHGSIGTSCAIAEFADDGKFTIDSHTQSPYWTAYSIADLLGISRDKVHLRHVQGSGCYGHNMADDAPADAALLARAVPGRPVRIRYSREDEHRLEPYGSAMIMRAKAGLDAKGDILDWDFELWSLPHNTRPKFSAGNLLPAGDLAHPVQMPTPKDIPAPGYGSDRNAIPLYRFPGQRIRKHFITEMPIRVSALRGLGAYANVFALESFMDEVARTSDRDPVEFRLAYLDDPRAKDVLAKAAETFGWDAYERKPGHGRGIAFAQYKNLACYTAVAIEVSVDDDGNVKVVRAVAANDSGEIVNPDGIDAQIEGGVIQSLSWSLKEEVKFENGRILSTDWMSYPILRFSEVPPIEVALINRPGEPYLGTGEGAQGPTAAALANAVFDASGGRCRQLPMTPERVKQAVAEA